MDIDSKHLKSIIYIQQKFKKYYYSKRILIVKSCNQTKEWRNSTTWYINGKKNECEIYQRDIIEKITKKKCIKSNYRFNKYSYDFIPKKEPYKSIDGFEWTEDLDGYIEYNEKQHYFNLKFVSDSGGAQRRTLCLVYDFIYIQLNYLKK